MNSLKKFLLKGRYEGLIILNGENRTYYKIDWFKEEINDNVYFIAKNYTLAKAIENYVDMPIHEIAAVIIGDDFKSRAQIDNLDWFIAEKALKNYLNEKCKKELFGLNNIITSSIGDEPKSIDDYICLHVNTKYECSCLKLLYPDSVWCEHEFKSSGKIRKYFTGIIYDESDSIRSVVAVRVNKTNNRYIGHDLNAVVYSENNDGYFLNFEHIH